MMCWRRLLFSASGRWFFLSVAAALLTQFSGVAVQCNGTVEQSDGGSGVSVVVSPESDLDLTTVFDCEGGEFDVSWSGVVSVPGTINIGSGTIVRIFGDNSSSSSGSNSGSSGGDINHQQRLQELATTLPPLPNGLPSAAVMTPQQTTTDGRVFFVNGGQLFLEDLAVVGGEVAVSSTQSSSSSIGGDDDGEDFLINGAGIHAVDANVTVTGCEFEDHTAGYLGGGIFAYRSTLVVVGSVFRRCQAGFVSSPGVDADGAGGGIAVLETDVLVDGCLFDDCYASKKGGGFHQEDGYVSILNSLFYNNTAGSGNEEFEDPVGEGGAISFIDCHGSFDGLASGGANDSVFVSNDAPRKGGAVVIWSKSAPSTVEFHRCTVENCTAGVEIQNDPQGEGGALTLGGGSTVILTDCLLVNNYAGEESGAISMMDGDDYDDGPVTILRNSTFLYNRAGVQDGGVASIRGWASVAVEGDGNVFAYNESPDSGAVFSAEDDTSITIEGGHFFNNLAEKAGVVYTKSNLTILGGTFQGNVASAAGEATGGAIFAADGSLVTINAGEDGGGGVLFESNEAKDGGAIYVYTGATVLVEGGVFSGNVAANSGGGISVVEDTNLEITGGTFSGNRADFGGFLYNRGAGDVSCVGGSVEGNQAVDGGGVYILENATLDWACGLSGNTALSGPALYARDNSTAVVQGITLQDNVANTGPVVLIVSSSDLRTYQVVFNDTSGSGDVSAVHVDQESSYKAEDTSFAGFAGEPIVFSEGVLFLDDCDFTASPASVLVYSEGDDTPVIRNIVLGNDNYYDDKNFPKADGLVNVNVTCTGGGEASSSAWSPCSEGSTCLNGAVGVYCLCYELESALEEEPPVLQERCVNGDPGSLRLATDTQPITTFYPQMLEGKLLLSLDPVTSTAATASTGTGTGTGSSSFDAAGSDVGVAWSISTSSVVVSDGEEGDGEELGAGVMDWTVYPSTGLLLPGQSIALSVETLPSEDFDGVATVSFAADAMVASEDDATSLSVDGASSQGNVSFDVTFYHCQPGQVWVPQDSAGQETSTSSSSGTSSDSTSGRDANCELCVDVVDEGAEGLNCSEPGVTTNTLPIKSGFWRASLDAVVIRECLNEDACTGGSSVASVAEYCNDGYEGPQCAVCASGYGGGVANTCHECTTEFKNGMYVAAAIVLLLVIVVAAVLAVYLVGGRDAVSASITKTKQTFRLDGSSGLFGRRSSRTWSFSSGGDFSRRSSGAKGAGDSTSSNFREHSSTKSAENLPSSRVASVDRSSGGGGRGGSQKGGGGALRAFAGAAAIDGRVGGAGSGSASALGEMTPAPAPASMRLPLGTPAGTGAAAASGRFDVEVAGRESSEAQAGTGEKKKTAAARISTLFSTLPLSKLKIVVVVWQMSSSFSEITQVPYPPVYERFLAIIGIFSFDLGWILSAACLATKIGFYEKLLMVTIGPAVLLCLLGVTFCIGSKKISAGRDTGVPTFFSGNEKPTAVANTGAATFFPGNEKPTAVTNTGAATFFSGNENPAATTNPTRDLLSTAPTNTATAAPVAQPGVHQAALGRRLTTARRNFEAGTGDETDTEQNGLWQLFSRHTTMALIILYLVYTQVSTVVFQTFTCEDFPEIGKRYLRADFRIECDTQKHEAYKIYAAIMICIYPFGIPAAFCYFLLRQRSRINPPVRKSSNGAPMADQREVMEKLAKRETDPAIAPTYFLWNAFLPNRYYYEVVECLRRLLLTGLLVFAMPNTSGQVALGCIFAFLSLMVFELLRPHSDHLERQLYRTGCLLIFFTNFLALMIKAEVANPDSGGCTLYSVALVIANALFFLAVFANTWVAAKFAYNKSDMTDIVLGIRVQEEADPRRRSGKPKTSKNGHNIDQTNLDEDQEMRPAWDDG